MLRKQLLQRAVLMPLLALPLLATSAAQAVTPLCKARAQGAAVMEPPTTVLPPPGFPPPPVYGFPATQYRAGWYNTHYWPRKTYHHGFYGDYWQSGYFPGY